jgi:hypothetical protein
VTWKPGAGRTLRRSKRLNSARGGTKMRRCRRRRWSAHRRRWSHVGTASSWVRLRRCDDFDLLNLPLRWDRCPLCCHNRRVCGRLYWAHSVWAGSVSNFFEFPQCTPLPRWVKLRRTQCEHMSSGLLPNSDIARRIRHFAFVPSGDSCTAAMSGKFQPVMGRVQRGRRSRSVASRSRSAWSEASRRHSQVHDVWSPHRRRQ